MTTALPLFGYNLLT